MARKKWPDECPVFIDGDYVVQGMNVRPGEIEVAYPDTGTCAAWTNKLGEPFSQWLSLPLFQKSESGWPLTRYKPLTPAARAMLEIAKAGAK